MKDYRETLNLPKTEFPMRANLKEKESEILKKWQELDIYSVLRERLKGKKKFILHDGPPYANGNIHIGHALNKILKDIIIKYKTMRGFDCPFIPGWDCHGLPVEHQLFKEMGKRKYEISQREFRKEAFNYAMRFVEIQKQEFQRLGVFGDWNSPYLTLSAGYEYQILSYFSKLVRKGFIYRALLPVNWCRECETALAEAEVEYEDKISPSVYVKFKLKEDLGFKKEVFLVIWTTTPWTLCSNVAVAVNGDFIYSFIETSEEIFLIAEDIRERIFKEMGLNLNSKVLRTIKGKRLKGLEYEHPFLKDSIIRKIVISDFVKKEEGTGFVHIAPGHGQEDHSIGLEYNLPVIMPVDGRGRFTNQLGIGELVGEDVHKADEVIIEILKEKHSLIHQAKILHSYPHCWRCKRPLIFRATEQWFLDIDKDKLRNRILEIIKKIEWVPKIGENRISAMVSTRPDWCLSRQRYWGTPIPAVECDNCKKIFLDPKIIENFLNFVRIEGADSWFKREIEEFLPSEYRCPVCSKEGHFKKTFDILDVWFDSGVSFSVTLERKGLRFPSDLYLEGSDQHRGWFQVSLICASVLENTSPFKSCLTHGFVVDGEGRKMSKSLGNVISPQKIIENYGADILRLWTASSDYSEDVRVSGEILDRLVEGYRKIRNTLRFLIANLCDFSPQEDTLEYSELEEIDRFCLYNLYQLLEDVTYDYENFKFYSVYKSVFKFCSEFLSAFYLDVLKDRLYTYSRNSRARRSAQTVLYQILDILIRIISPVLVFTGEEAYSCLPAEREASVHLTRWPKPDKNWRDEDLSERWNKILKLREEVLKAIEEERIEKRIAGSLECEVTLSTNDKKEYKFLEKYLKDLQSVFIVSGVKLKFSVEKSFKGITIERAEGKKCIRCWNYSLSVGRDILYPELCERCLELVKEYA